MRIVVVDDDVDAVVVLQKALSAVGLDVITVTDCAAAREAASKLVGLDAVITDLMLCDGYGVKLARDLRRTYGCATAVVSGFPMPDEGLPADIDLWITKPISLAQFGTAIEGLLDSRGRA
jgi:DNA-binding response OmpR family regulator